MKVAFILYPGLTLLDLVGVYDPISRLKRMNLLPDLSWDFCALDSSVQDGEGWHMQVTNHNANLGEYDVAIVPGARFEFIQAQINNTDFMQWLATIKQVKLIASVCTGSLLLGALGLLKGLEATTHPAFLDELAQYCQKVSEQRVVVANENVITVGGVTSGIDLGLCLCEKFAGSAAKHEIANIMDYSIK